MINQASKRSWLPGVIILAAVGLAAYYLSTLTSDYRAKHQWPEIAGLAVSCFAAYGIWDLFWSIIPHDSLSKIIITLGIVMMLICWLAVGSIPGMIVGAVATLMGGMMTLQRH